MSSDPTKPDLKLLMMLGSIAVHTEELLSPKGHAVDRGALAALLHDPDVEEWLKQMDKMALIPKKRE